MTTAVAEMKDVMESFRGRCDVYLFKPIDIAELLHISSADLVVFLRLISSQQT